MGKSPIEAQLHGLRRRVRQLLGLHGVSWVLALAIGLTLASGLLDWLLELSAGVRAILLGIVAVATVWTVYRMLLAPLLFRLRDVDLAQRVEAQFPKLNDQLASAVEFLKEPPQSEGSGSPTLRQAVVDQAARHLVALNVNSVLDWSAARRAAMSAAGIVALAGAIVLASPDSVRIALARLVHPFGDTAWPRQTHLGLVAPVTRLARGDAFRLTVEVTNGRVPARAEVYYLFEGGETANEPLRPQGDRRFTGGLEAATRSFDFYVRAGDGLTESMHVDVVPPPELEGLKLRLTYPTYTGQPAEELPEGKGQVRAVWGTQVELSARSSKPLARAEVRTDPDATIAAPLAASETEFAASFRLEESGSYWIALHDRDGFDNRQASRYELRVLADQPPDVFIERPSSDIEVTPTADVPLRVVIKDDFGTHDATLHHTGSSSEGTATDVTLWSGSDRPRRQVLDHTWHLAELGLSPGSTVSYHVSARDWDDLRGPNVGQSRQLRLIIVTPEDLTRRLEDKQIAIYGELERLRKLQVEARTQVAGLQERLAEEPSLTKPDLAHLLSAEATQRQITRRVTSPSEGVQSQVRRVLDDLANNRIANSAVNEQMAAVSAALDQIAREELPPVEQNLARARKAAEESQASKSPRGADAPDSRNPQRAGLDQAKEHQDAVVTALDEMLERMGKWETYRGIVRDARELLEQQETLAGQTGEVGRKTIGQKRESLPPETQAELSKLAARQDQAREQLNRLQRKMEQMSGKIADSDPVGSDAIREAMEQSRQGGVTDQMQRAASNIRQNQVGSAETAQRQAVDELKQMLDTLEGSRERDLAKLVAKLKEAEAKLADIRNRQAEVLKRTQEAQDSKNAEERRRELEKLARQERELQQQTGRLAQQMRRMRAEQAGRTSSSASSRMGQAGEQLNQSQGEQAQAEEQKVLEELEKAQQELAQARREVEAELAMEQLAKIADTLAALHERQNAVKEETIRLDKARSSQSNWTRPQLASLRSTADTQKNIQQDSDKAREVLTSAPVFALVLTRAISNMQRAHDRLNDHKADAETQAAEQAAADRFGQLLDSLKKDPKDPNAAQNENQQSGGGGGAGSGGGQPGDAIPPIAQLKMLRSLQIEINERTQELAELRQTERKLTPAQQNELKSLSEEQGVLADLVDSFLQPEEQGDKP